MLLLLLLPLLISLFEISLLLLLLMFRIVTKNKKKAWLKCRQLNLLYRRLILAENMHISIEIVLYIYFAFIIVKTSRVHRLSLHTLTYFLRSLSLISILLVILMYNLPKNVIFYAKIIIISPLDYRVLWNVYIWF